MDKDKPIKFNLEDIKKAVIRKFPLIGDAFSAVQFHEDRRVKTASTDGKDIFYNQEFMDSLTYNQQIFTIAHEGLHIAFEHVTRQDNKQIKEKKHRKLWNIATDAVINQALKSEGLPIKKGFVNIAEALNQSADYMYSKLLEEYNRQKENQENSPSKSNQPSPNGERGESGGQGSNNHDSNDQNSENNPNDQEDGDPTEEEEQSISDWANQFGDTVDDHDFWEGNEAESTSDDDLDDENETQSTAKSTDNDNNSEENKNDTKPSEDESEKESEDETTPKKESGKDLEKDFQKKNQDKKKEISDQIMKKIQEQKDRVKDFGNNAGNTSKGFGEVGESQSIYNWRKILRREFDDYIRQWSNRRANKSNGWSSRIASIYTYDKPRTEVLLDTSGSVDDELLKGFLRQLKPMLRDSELFVGCFDTKFYGFTEVKSNKDIDNFIVKGRGGTNLDIAVRAFSKDDKINKVIFTDGAGTMPKKDLEKIQRLFWVIFDSQNFNPCCGKVLYADSNDVKKGLKLFQENEGM